MDIADTVDTAGSRAAAVGKNRMVVDAPNKGRAQRFEGGRNRRRKGHPDRDRRSLSDGRRGGVFSCGGGCGGTGYLGDSTEWEGSFALPDEFA